MENIESANNKAPLDEAIESARSIEDLEELLYQYSLKSSAGEDYSPEDFLYGVKTARTTRFSNLNLITREKNLREQTAKVLITEAESFEELLSLLENIEVIAGSQHAYTREELITLINGIRESDENLVNQLTQTNGLRDTVYKILGNQISYKKAA